MRKLFCDSNLLIKYFEDERLELYNLADDIGEMYNLAEDMPEKTNKMHQMLKDWWEDADAQMPTLNPDYDPERMREFWDEANIAATLFVKQSFPAIY